MKIFNLIFFFKIDSCTSCLRDPLFHSWNSTPAPNLAVGHPLPSPPHFPAATRLHSTGTLEVEEAQVVEEVEEEERWWWWWKGEKKPMNFVPARKRKRRRRKKHSFWNLFQPPAIGKFCVLGGLKRREKGKYIYVRTTSDVSDPLEHQHTTAVSCSSRFPIFPLHQSNRNVRLIISVQLV